jgi:hypothetical protein
VGYSHQFKTSFKDIDGEFNVDRFVSRASISYMPHFAKSVGLSVGYDRNAYTFPGPTGISSSDPWRGINTVRIGAPVRWGFDEEWTLFVIPTVRWTLADGADWGRSVSGGGFVGFSYRFNDSLTAGPGFGALSQLEESPSYFPVLIVDWDITERLNLATGRGLGASQGPGLQLSYELSETWGISLGGRYERFRFRLNADAPSPHGVGQDRGVPMYLGVRYSWSPKGSLALLGGADLGGQLQLMDDDGDEVASSGYEPAPFLGFALDLKF